MSTSATDTATQAADLDITIDLSDPPSLSEPVSHSFAPRVTRATTPSAQEPPSQVTSAAQGQPRLPLAPGRVLCDRYVLTRIISSGEEYTVFCARDLEAHHGPKFVALKTPRPDHSEPLSAVERLRQEFEATRSLPHGGIIEAFEFGSEGDISFMTMELLEGESLATVMRSRGARLVPHLARRVLRGLSDALAYAHAVGVAHGNLDSANVFILKGDRIKLTGFGARKPAVTRNATRSYASPQVLEGRAAEPRDDVFSFACIAYEALTGTHPFEQRSAAVALSEGAHPEPPEHLTNEQSLALMAALAFEAEARPQDLRALARTLAPDPQRTRVHAIEPEIPAPPPADDKRWWIFAAACIVTMIAAVVYTRLS